jgi:biofilm PGA synthesis N-glycosyltransferase PgaC
MPNVGRYIVVSPVRNEGEYLQGTIDSMVRQTITPTLWMIVNDGSTDNTPVIAENACRQHAWIKAIHLNDRGFRKAGGGVVDAFYEGFSRLETVGWDFIVKLDGDVSFEADYFERCLGAFADDVKLGIAGGTVCLPGPGDPRPESSVDPRFHVRGATKIYKAECWDGIGGLIRAPGWDTLDEVKANMLGWRTATLERIRITHHRPTGAAYGTWNDRVKSGLANYITGYHPLFMALKCAKRMTERPYVITGAALFFGFIKGYILRLPQVPDQALVRYLREQQMNRILGRKSLWN